MDHTKLSVESDLTATLSFGKDRVTLSASSLIVEGSQGTLDFRLDEIKEARVEEGIGIGKLLIRNNVSEVECAYFTKRKLEEFRHFANVINSRINGETNIGKKHLLRRRENGNGTVSWLAGFMKPYVNILIAGVALSVIITMLSLVPPLLIKSLIDNVLNSSAPNYALFTSLTVSLFAALVGVVLFSIIQNYMLSVMGQKIINDLKKRVFGHVMKLSSSLIDKIETGRIISRLTTDVGNTQWLVVWGFPTVVSNVLMLIGLGIVLFSMDPGLAVYILLPVPVAILAILRYKGKSHKLYHRNWRRSADVTSAIADTVPNYPLIKSFSGEDFENRRISGLLGKVYESQKRVIRMNQLYWPVLGFITAFSTVLIWWVGGHQVLAGGVKLGVVTAFVFYMAMFYGPINNLSNIIPFVQQSLTSGDRIRELIETRIDIRDAEKPRRPRLDREIRFEKVSFGYEPFMPVIKNVSIRIGRGETVSIVGRSGSGKSTISKMLLRFYDADEGRITIGGVDIKDISMRHLREHIAYVPQDDVLFDNTVTYNVAYGRDGAAPSDIIGACKAANIHNEIMALPTAYDTNMGERGSSLSGGQKQRISIARAIIKEPDIVILDEATSNLDVKSEREIYRAILNLTWGKTSIFITHNANEVMNSDRIVLMKRGRIAEEGSPHELLRRKGDFYRMFREQIRNGEFRREKRDAERSSIQHYILAAVASGKNIRIREGSRKSLVNAVIKGSIVRDLIPSLPFPISSAHFVILRRLNGEEIAFVEDMAALDPVSRSILENAVSHNNFKPRITSVAEIKIRGDELEWDIGTPSGKTQLTTRGRRNVILEGRKIILIDTYDDIYEIDLDSLDSRSYKILDESI